jgi:hypothetical protein
MALVRKEARTSVDYRVYGDFEPADFVRIHCSDLAQLLWKLQSLTSEPATVDDPSHEDAANSREASRGKRTK